MDPPLHTRSGTIPTSHISTKLKYLRAQGCTSLSGTFPSGIQTAENLRVIDLAGMEKLSGTIPATTCIVTRDGTNTNCAAASASSAACATASTATDVTGAANACVFTPGIKHCALLEEIVVGRGGVAGYHGSKVSGTLPESTTLPVWGQIHGLKDFNMGCNLKLSGTLPISLGKLHRLRTVNVGGAFKMTGNLPGDFGYLTGLQTLMTRYTKINGPLPTVEGGLGQLSLCGIGTMAGDEIEKYERIGLANPSGSCKMPWESECLGETEGTKGEGTLRDACDAVRSNDPVEDSMKVRRRRPRD